MLEIFETDLRTIDGIISSSQPCDYPELFRNVPLEVFGKIQIERPANLPNINRILPAMPSDDVQNNWTGTCGHRLLQQSVAFIRTVVGHYAAHSTVPLREGLALDYGCGWGRLTRLLYKYVPYDRIWGVDPWDRSIEACRSCGLLGHLAISDYLPTSLPVEGNKFDLIIAFSVFSHLSERATRMAASVLASHLSETGLLAITIRPVEYWDFHSRPRKLTRNEIREVKALHHDIGFAFAPHNRAPVDGDVTYGDSSMTLDYIAKTFPGLRIVGLDWNETDSLQIIVFLARGQVPEAD
jgi:SAM-dependent methyltransferase